MKNINQYIKESLLDDEEDLLDGANDAIIKYSIRKFIEDNYETGEIYIKQIGDKYYTVDCKNDVNVKNKNIISLTNEFFEWGVINGDFSCTGCKSLTSLEGAPKNIKGHLWCRGCKSLKSLKGAPEKIRGGFYCDKCDSLTSLEGAPKRLGGDFDCSECPSLTSLEGAPKRLGGDFSCTGCKSLTSLKGAPKKVSYFHCYKCPSLTSLEGAPEKAELFYCGSPFKEEDVKKVCNAKKIII